VLKLATYNILHGHYSKLILENLQILIEKNVDVVCIQEADKSFQDFLNDFLQSRKWKIIYFNNTKGCNLAIAWNPLHLSLSNSEQVFLPKLSKPSLMQRATYFNEIFQRGAISTVFSYEDKEIRITNTHLGWEGGIKKTLSQLSYLRDFLSKKEDKYAILAGDFNTFAPAVFRNFKTKKVEIILKDKWINAFPDLAWSCDVSYSVPSDGYNFIEKIFTKLHLNLRSLLDYVFVNQNTKVISKEMFDLPGSDHRPIVVELGL
jgi:endonuclease/exonuclease/phosphatase family metal-dependent hydrolase